jgi:hypothetical protein
MAINKNHEFEELNGVKCGIVEKMVKPERAAFLKALLEWNGYTVVMVPSPLPKATPPPPPAAAGEEAPPSPPPAPPVPETYTLGVTDYTFNTINAIFGRMLKTREGSIVTLAYWNQQEAVSNDEVPYFES